MIELILILITLAALILATIIDIKTREIPDWISYSLIILALVFSMIISIKYLSFNPFLLSLLGLIIAVIFSLSLYYTKQWGGGDAKIFMALGIIFITYPRSLLKFFNPNLNLPFLLILIINILLVAVLYSLIYMVYTIIKNKEKTLKLLKKYKYKKLKVISIILTLILITLSFYMEEKTYIFILAVLILAFPYIMLLTKITENISMIKTIPIVKLAEGDWLAESVYKNNKLILNKNKTEITKEDIQKLKKLNIYEIKIKEGIPFMPVFLIAVIISLILGNLMVL